MLLDTVKKYLSSDVKPPSSDLKTPYFLFISDDKYNFILEELLMEGLELIRLSDYCSEDDKIPNIDKLLNDISTGDKKLVLKGLGEYLALMGDKEASKILSRFKEENIGDAKLILLLRGLRYKIPELQSDPRFNTRQCSVIDEASCDLSFTLADPSIRLSTLTGFKVLLADLENGRRGNVVCNTNVSLDNSLFTIHKINSAYDGILFNFRGFNLPASCGNEIFWAELLSELNMNNGSLDEVFDKHGFGSSLETDFYSRITGINYRNWIYFIALKCKTESLNNGYLRFVLEKTDRFDDFNTNILNAIIDVTHTDKRFTLFYSERKALVKQFRESDIANFVVNNRKIPSESIYKLTDNTITECEEIIALLSNNGMNPQIKDIYPALSDYLKKYIFKCPELADLLTDYFKEYKRQKILNVLEADFLLKVEELAKSPRKFNRLPTRNEILDKLDKTNTFLYWLDALGVEFLAYIESLANNRGLSISISIARAELPTITNINRDFFDLWQGSKNGDNGNKELDEIKHKDKGGYNFTNNTLPIHLVKELEVISSVIDKAATDLSLRKYKRFLITSDHGASRLAVLCRKEEQYETDTKGEHSGRCCKAFQPYDLLFAAEENGFLVLADYGRFKGSRAANVEVHGGASLEEVVVPIIELTLKNENIKVKLVDEVVVFDFRSGVEIKLFINSSVQDVSVILNGKHYLALQVDTNHYSVKLIDIKRAGEYSIDVYAGDDLIDKVELKVQSRSGKINDAFDDLF